MSLVLHIWKWGFQWAEDTGHTGSTPNKGRNRKADVLGTLRRETRGWCQISMEIETGVEVSQGQEAIGTRIV